LPLFSQIWGSAINIIHFSKPKILLMRSTLIVLIMAFAACIFSQSALAQTTKLPGKVTEENGNPIPGASIRFSNKKTGVITQNDGAFEIQSTGTGTLIISALGYDEQTIDVRGLDRIVAKMVRNNKQLDEAAISPRVFRVKFPAWRSGKTIP
jgi:hypothetical protein